MADKTEQIEFNPDNIYPVPNCFGPVNPVGVNLLSGEVNLEFPICVMTGVGVVYYLNLFYNSRSAAMHQTPQNQLGGHGWKLMDYPKIIEDRREFYFLDGKAAYLLTGSENHFRTYREFSRWKFEREQDTWSITTDQGHRYKLEHHSDIDGYEAWHITLLEDLNWGDKITFDYAEHRLMQIKNTLGSVASFIYDEGLLVKVDQQIRFNQEIIHFSYGHVAGEPLLIGIQPSQKNGPGSSLVDLGACFSYLTSNHANPYAMHQMISPLGEVRSYSYYTGDELCENGVVVKNLHPVIGVQTRQYPDDNDTVGNTYLALYYHFGNWTYDQSRTYAQFNQVKEYPGTVPRGESFWQLALAETYGHETYYFFNGRRREELLEFEVEDPGDCDRLALRGKAYLSQELKLHKILEKVATAGSVTRLGRRESVTTPAQNVIGLTFWAKSDLQNSRVYISLYDRGRNLIANLESPVNYRSKQEIQFALETTANIGTIGLRSSGGFTEVGDVYLTCIKPPEDNGESVSLLGRKPADDRLCERLSSEKSHHLLKELAPGSDFAMLVRVETCSHGVSQTTKISYGGEYFLPTTFHQDVRNPKLDEGGKVSRTFMKRTVSYAFEQHAALKEKNILGAPLQVTQWVRNRSEEPWVVASSRVQHWKDWGDGKWETLKSYELKRKIESEQLPDGLLPNPPANDWIQTSEVSDRNERGLPLAVRNHDQITISESFYTRPRTSVFPIARFANAEITANQAGYYGFGGWESFEGWQAKGGEAGNGDSFTGDSSYYGKDLSFSRVNFQPKLAPAYFVAAYVRSDEENAQCTVGFKNGSEWQSSVSYEFEDNEWQYVQCVLARPEERDHPTVEVTRGAIDHIIFAPVDAPFTINIWNLLKKRIEAQVTNNGAVRRFYYDMFENIVATSHPGTKLSTITMAYNSLLGNAWLSKENPWQFRRAHPNMRLRVEATGSATWEPFLSRKSKDFPEENLTLMKVDGYGLGTLGVSPGEEGVAIFSGSPGGEDFAIFTEAFFHSQVQREMGLSLCHGSDDIRVMIQKYDAIVLKNQTLNQVLQEENLDGGLDQQPGFFKLLVVVSSGNHLTVYLEGRLLLDHRFDEGKITAPIRLVSSSPMANFRNFGFMDNPRLHLQTFDAAGQKKQSLGQDSSAGTRVAETHYGRELNLPMARTKSTHLPDSNGLTFRGDFSRFNSTDLTVSGSVTKHWPTSFCNQPFSRSITHHPTPHLHHASHGTGGLFTAGRKARRFDHGDTEGEYFNFNDTDIKRHTTIDPDGLRTVQYSDGEHLLYGKAVVSGNHQQLTGNEYDERVRPTARYYPNSFTDGKPDRQHFFRKTEFDFQSNPVSQSDSDSGVKRYQYDAAGRLRLMQDDVGAEQGYSLYTRHDPLGRQLEEGLFKGSFDDVTEEQLNDPLWPQASTQWLKRYVYDFDPKNQDDPNTFGRLLRIETPQTELRYLYDLRGNVTTVALTNEEDTTEVEYEYSASNQVTRIKCGQDYDVFYGYDNSGRVISVGTPEQPNCYAQYTYANGKVNEKLNDGTIGHTITKNAAGWTEQIDGQYFKETLFYERRKNGKMGYHNGQVASADYHFEWEGAPSDYHYEYTYDPFGRLVKADHSNDAQWSIGAGSGQETRYDPNGNVLSITRGNTPIQYTYQDKTNRVDNTGPGQSFSYHANGNVTGCQRLQIERIDYDPLSNLTTGVQANQVPVEFTYDGQERRIKVSPGSNETPVSFIHGLNFNPLLEIVEGGPETTISYIYGPTGLIAIKRDGKVWFAIKDHRSSTRVVVGQNGEVAAYFNYMPFGELITNHSNPGSEIPIRFRFTGESYDHETRLYYFHARLYDPYLARFFAPDPRHQFASPYLYSDNPISFTDPTGELFGIDDIILSTIVLAGIGAIVGASVGAGHYLLKRYEHGKSVQAKDLIRSTAVGGFIGGLSGILIGVFPEVVPEFVEGEELDLYSVADSEDLQIQKVDEWTGITKKISQPELRDYVKSGLMRMGKSAVLTGLEVSATDAAWYIIQTPGKDFHIGNLALEAGIGFLDGLESGPLWNGVSGGLGDIGKYSQVRNRFLQIGANAFPHSVANMSVKGILGVTDGHASVGGIVLTGCIGLVSGAAKPLKTQLGNLVWTNRTWEQIASLGTTAGLFGPTAVLAGFAIGRTAYQRIHYNKGPFES